MMEEKLIAPCEMNCDLCFSYLAMKYDLKRQGFAERVYHGRRYGVLEGGYNGDVLGMNVKALLDGKS